MSVIPLEERVMNCQLIDGLSKTNVIGSHSLVDAGLEAYANDAVEELGDVIDESEQFVMRCISETGIEIPIEDAKIILSSLAGCLQQRYLGNCQAVASCNGRDEMAKRLEKLEMQLEQTK